MRIAFASMTALWFVFASVAPAAPLSVSYTYGLGPESQPAAEYPDGAYPDIPADSTELNDDTIGTTTFSGSSSTDPWVGFIDQASNGQPQPQIDIAFTDPL